MSDAGPTPAEAEFPLAFCLASVLTGLGHPCASGLIVDDPALGGVWFSRHRRSGRAAWDGAQDAEPLSLHHLFRRLNECTRQHGIHLLPRRKDDRGRALSGAWTVSA